MPNNVLILYLGCIVIQCIPSISAQFGDPDVELSPPQFDVVDRLGHHPGPAGKGLEKKKEEEPTLRAYSTPPPTSMESVEGPGRPVVIEVMDNEPSPFRRWTKSVISAFNRAQFHGRDPFETEPWNYRGEFDPNEEFDPEEVGRFVRLIMNVAQLIFACIILFFYQKRVFKKKRRAPQRERIINDNFPDQTVDFPDNLFSCFDDCETCWMMFCCGPCRRVDTYVTAGFLDRGLTAIAAAVAFSVAPILYFFLCCYYPCKRTHLRTHLGGGVPDGEEKDCGCFGRTTFTDFCITLCCSFCAAVQEARAVDLAAGDKTVCCCDIRRSATVSQESVMLPIRVRRNGRDAPLLPLSNKDATDEDEWAAPVIDRDPTPIAPVVAIVESSARQVVPVEQI